MAYKSSKSWISISIVQFLTRSLTPVGLERLVMVVAFDSTLRKLKMDYIMSVVYRAMEHWFIVGISEQFRSTSSTC